MSPFKATTMFGVAMLAGAVFGSARPTEADVIIFTANLSPANEVPPVNVPAGQKSPSGTAIIMVNTSGGFGGGLPHVETQVGLTGFAPNDLVNGLQIRQGIAGINGQLVGDGGIMPNSPIPLSGGDTIFTAPDGTLFANSLPAQMLNNPEAFYLNVNTTSHPSGAVRGQLERLGNFQGIGLDVFVNKGTYAPGDPFQLNIFLGNGGPQVTVDLFAGLFLSPEASAALGCATGFPQLESALVFLTPNGPIVQCLNAATNFHPLAQNVVIPSGLPLGKFTLFNTAIPDMGGGEHRVFFCMKRSDQPDIFCDFYVFDTTS